MGPQCKAAVVIDQSPGNNLCRSGSFSSYYNCNTKIWCQDLDRLGNRLNYVTNPKKAEIWHRLFSKTFGINRLFTPVTQVHTR